MFFRQIHRRRTLHSYWNRLFSSRLKAPIYLWQELFPCLIQTERSNTWHVHTFKNTKGLYVTEEWASFRSSAHLSAQHYTHTSNMCLFFPWCEVEVISLVRAAVNAETWIDRIKGIKLSSSLLSDAPIVSTVNTGVGGGNLTMPVGNCSIYAHKMPRFWFMALPLGHGFLSPPLVAIQTSQHNYNIYCCWTTLSNIT